MCIAIVEIWVGIANGQILSIFDSFVRLSFFAHISEMSFLEVVMDSSVLNTDDKWLSSQIKKLYI